MHIGLFIFTVMPFWLCNEPATFQPLMVGIFRDQRGKVLGANLDDPLMYSIRQVEMGPILARTLGQLIDAGLTGKACKCEVFSDSIQYLGHFNTHGKIAADRGKLH